CPEAEVPLGTRRVEAAPRLPVGSIGIPDHLTLEAGFGRDGADELLDGDLTTGTEIDGLDPGEAGRGEHDPIGRVGDVEELPRGAPRAPNLDPVAASFDGVHALLDQRRDDVGAGGIEVVARP